MDKKRERIGILFNYSEAWIGGSYYFINLVSALCTLPDTRKPIIIIVSKNSESYHRIKETNYPYLEYLPAAFKYNKAERLVNKICRILSNNNLIKKGYTSTQLPILFGYYEQLYGYTCNKKLFWIPDLQEKFYPQYIGESIALNRAKIHKKIIKDEASIVFSSQDSCKHFQQFYPTFRGQPHVVPFAVTLPDFQHINFGVLAKKYGIEEPYFFAPNQFWPHKNHITVIKAIELLKYRKIEVKVIFTGNENTGDGTYSKSLKHYVEKKGLNGNCIFLGFIDREEQLTLMQEAVSVVQPSLFEGWSTVVEDAKALKKHIILSNIAVHHEQIKDDAIFFSPEDENELANILLDVLKRAPLASSRSLYENDIVFFANEFLSAFENS